MSRPLEKPRNFREVEYVTPKDICFFCRSCTLNDEDFIYYCERNLEINERKYVNFPNEATCDLWEKRK